jgi:hypothetical protein
MSWVQVLQGMVFAKMNNLDNVSTKQVISLETESKTQVTEQGGIPCTSYKHSEPGFPEERLVGGQYLV